MRLIDADATIIAIAEVKRIMNTEIKVNNRKDLINFVNGLNQACISIEQKETVERPRGKWIFKNDNIALPTEYGHFECSRCGVGKVLIRDNFCPACGAEMSEVEE